MSTTNPLAMLLLQWLMWNPKTVLCALSLRRRNIDVPLKPDFTNHLFKLRLIKHSFPVPCNLSIIQKNYLKYLTNN